MSGNLFWPPNLKKKSKAFFFLRYIKQLFSADATIFFKKWPQKVEKNTFKSWSEILILFFITALSCPNGPNRRIHVTKCGLISYTPTLYKTGILHFFSAFLFFNLFIETFGRGFFVKAAAVGVPFLLKNSHNFHSYFVDI